MELRAFVFALAWIAVALLPFAVLVFRVATIARGLSQIRGVFRTKSVGEKYAARFLPTRARVEANGPREVEDEVATEFLQVHDAVRYLKALVPLVVVLGIGMHASALWADARIREEVFAPLYRVPSTAVVAFLGAYVWSLYEVVHRAVLRDLSPDVVWEILCRHVVAIPLGFAASKIAVEGAQDLLAFGVSAFPLRDVRLLIRQRAIRALGKEPEQAFSREGLIGTMIDGISADAIARLGEVRITTYVELAYADPIRLMGRTGYPLRPILAWIDQALLAVYAPTTKNALTAACLPCALDACEFYREHLRAPSGEERPGWREKAVVKELAGRVQLPVELLPELFQRLDADPHVRFLDAIWDQDREIAASSSRPESA